MHLFHQPIENSRYEPLHRAFVVGIHLFRYSACYDKAYRNGSVSEHFTQPRKGGTLHLEVHYFFASVLESLNLTVEVFVDGLQPHVSALRPVEAGSRDGNTLYHIEAETFDEFLVGKHGLWARQTLVPAYISAKSIFEV